MNCSLCQHSEIQLFFENTKNSWKYFVCSRCELVFRDPETFLDSSSEKARYETHNNSIENPGYVKFLSPNIETLLPFLNEKSQGLDYGAGPGPIIDQLFKPHGIEVVNYDPYFFHEPNLLEKQYDFVTCTEVFEHFYNPHKEMQTLSQIVKPRGYLLLMTEFRRDAIHFSKWGYPMDNTHVIFLNERGLDWICGRWGFEKISCDGRISLLQKNL